MHLAPVLDPGATKRLPIERDRVVEPACRVLVLVLSGLVLLARVLLDHRVEIDLDRLGLSKAPG